MIRKATRFTLVLAAVLLLGGAVTFAQTPDGETPSAETVCDLLKEPQYTPGLYGLCVAFCEALDGESFDPLGICDVAPSKVLENYNRLRGPNDPMMPCLRPECPCFDVEDVLALPVKWCEIGTGGTDCYYVAEGSKEAARVWKSGISQPAMCYYKNDGAKIKITDNEAASCLAVLAEARGDMACKERTIACPKL